MQVVSPVDSQRDGRPVLGRMRAVRVDQGHQARIEWPLRDTDGQAIDLSTGFTTGPFVKLYLTEATQNNRAVQHVLSGSVVDAASGKVAADLDEVSVKLAGVALGNWIVWDGDPSSAPPGTDTRPVISERFYLFIDPSLVVDANAQPFRPPSLQMLRLKLRDSAPADNPLLLDREFDLAEICDAYVRPIQLFNEQRPILSRLFTTMDFPYTDRWLDGIAGELFLMAADFYLRNALNYQAGGLAINDRENKIAPYQQIGTALLESFRRFAMAEKHRLSTLGAFGSVTSVYGRPGWW